MLIFSCYLLAEGGYLSIRFHNAKYFFCAALTNAFALPVFVACCALMYLLPVIPVIPGQPLSLAGLIASLLPAALVKAVCYRAMIGWRFWRSILFSFCAHVLITGAIAGVTLVWIGPVVVMH